MKKSLILLFLSFIALFLIACNTDNPPIIDTRGENNISSIISPTFSSDYRTLTYGLYPQTNVTEASLISELNKLSPKENGWYLYNDVYYAKLVAKPQSNGRSFDNGNAITPGVTYWFKCEPILWDVLKDNGGRYLVQTHLVLDCTYYDLSGSNNYKNSDLRAFLINNFYNSAFQFNSTYIIQTEVDNSAETTDAVPNQYACENTLDYVFALSYKDYLNPDLGFVKSTNNSKTRESKPTDYAKASGVLMGDGRANRDYAYYWTRSPYYDRDKITWVIYADGYVFHAYNVYENLIGVRPAMYLELVNTAE